MPFSGIAEWMPIKFIWIRNIYSLPIYSPELSSNTRSTCSINSKWSSQCDLCVWWLFNNSTTTVRDNKRNHYRYVVVAKQNGLSSLKKKNEKSLCSFFKLSLTIKFISTVVLHHFLKIRKSYVFLILCIQCGRHTNFDITSHLNFIFAPKRKRSNWLIAELNSVTKVSLIIDDEYLKIYSQIDICCSQIMKRQI